MAVNFVNGDIVVHKSDSARRVWRVAYATGELMQIEPVNDGGEPKQEYPHLLTLAEPLMQFFRFAHLPQALQDKSFPFWELANKIVVEYPRNPERTVALRKLLEAKDAAVRSTIYQG